MTNVMTWLPSASCACGQPWEAHELRCPRQKHQGVGRVVALAVAGGIIVQILFLLVAALVVAGLTRPSTVLAGPLTLSPQAPSSHGFARASFSMRGKGPTSRAC
jgi:hypothetical protein